MTRLMTVSPPGKEDIVELEDRTDRFTAIEDLYKGYTVYDMNYEKIDKVDDLFVDESDQIEYIGVKMSFLGLRSTLIPVNIVRVNEQRQLIEVADPKDRIKDAPTFDNNEEITPDLERRVYSHFGLTGREGERENYSAYYYDEERERTGGAADEVGPDIATGDREAEGFQPQYSGEEGVGGHEDELRLQRSEEELRDGVREREAGRVNVRKRVRTERERMAVPRRREEINVERVRVNEPTSSAEIGEDEVVIPVIEEEIVVQKRAVVREEIRVRKDVVEEEEIVEADLRKEEVEVEDTTKRRDV